MGMRERPGAGIEELHRVAGTVRTKAGEPAAGAWVVLPETGGFAVADAEGRFSVASVRAGSHRLKARGADGGEAETSADVPGAPIELHLQ